MYNIALFAEDHAHEQFLGALIGRLASENAMTVRTVPYNVRGGFGRTLTELRQLVRHIDTDRVSRPDLLLIGCDVNCKGYKNRRKEIENRLGSHAEYSVLALPDPHIERWLLLDSAAFKKVLGRGCNAPDQKCGHRRYKQLLLQAVRAAGLEPLLGGIEHTKEIVEEMDFDRMAKADTSFGHTLSDLRKALEHGRA